eukprot:CCRYP_011748-RA/>CCRYP_011748-RA protein AED:0.26 eAED:0.26 QI:0/0/0/1/0/0/5/0/530
MCLMDMEFKPLEDLSQDVPVNTTAAREHVGDIERALRHCMPNILIVFLLRFVVLWLNAFPSDHGASTEFSPREIVTGLCMDYRTHCRARWGAYAEASQDPNVTNTMSPRTAPCIALGPTGNVQGSMSCYNLETKQVESVSKELRSPILQYTHELTPDQKKQALASLIFLTEKWCGRIKTRACVNGSAQRDYIPKESAASPTVMNDCVMIQSAIGAHEGRVVVTLDIPGAFLHADLDEEVIMLLRGQLADLMVQVDPDLYGPCLTKRAKGESILYVRMLKAMYGLLRSALLFYLKLVKDLSDYGFEVNPYDPCVANKMEIGKASLTPASENLFRIHDPEENDAHKKWLSPELCRDIQTAVAFLTTRVKRPDEDDWGKLKRVLKYLKGTRHMRLRLGVDDLRIIQWWVDASYNVHEDCRGQTGAMLSLGQGAPISFSRKQKLNVRSSCEGELVGIDDALPLILWARYFIEAQGYSVEQNIMYQDNKSTILLANNGRWSSSRKTKHIKSRYFLIKDKVQSGEVSVEHRATDKM